MGNKAIIIVISVFFLVLLILVGAGVLFSWNTGGKSNQANMNGYGFKTAATTDAYGMTTSNQTTPATATTTLENDKPAGTGIQSQEQRVGETPAAELTPEITLEKTPTDSMAPQTKPATAKDTTAAKKLPDKKPEPVVKKTIPEKQPQLKDVKEYWIQTASFTNRSNAEQLNEKLIGLGYPGTIKTKSIEGKTYFRIRIGPYPSLEEANKFLIWIKSIAGLEDSWVAQVTTQKYLY